MTDTDVADLPSRNLTAVADSRYVNQYNYAPSQGGWILITGAEKAYGHINVWTFVPVDSVWGCPIGATQERVSVDLWANQFAHRPFDVDHVQDDRAWFAERSASIANTVDAVNELYARYRERLSYCHSFEALLRIGIPHPDEVQY